MSHRVHRSVCPTPDIPHLLQNEINHHASQYPKLHTKHLEQSKRRNHHRVFRRCHFRSDVD
eukprot:CCRYP_015931-RA/>CCRYP_015931-RA protein AED:0.48 eAED:0.60 QI:0/0/0.5/1/0/0/2/7/60